MSGRSVNLRTVTHGQLKADPPNLAILPWGATEAHNQHLPYCSDVIQAEETSLTAAELAYHEGAKVIVLPAVPFGNNAQHLDQHGTIHLSTTTAMAVLGDVVNSLLKQNIDKLLIVNSHGGNNFKQLVRDLQEKFPIFIVAVDLYLMIPEKAAEIFDNPGDHAGQLETSFMMHLRPNDVKFEEAQDGARVPFEINALKKAGVWTPRPWSRSHPSLGSGNPEGATAEKGKAYFEALCEDLKEVIIDISKAEKGMIPY